MKAEIDKVFVEPTGFKAGDRVPMFVARCYRQEPSRMEWAYGDSETDAFTRCKVEPQVLDLADVLKMKSV